MPLNHGSFGATPSEILVTQRHYREEFDLNREGFLNNRFFNLLEDNRKAISGFVKAKADDIVLIGNATEAVNAVFKSISLVAGDEILITNHAYANYPPLIEQIAQDRGFKVKIVNLPFPLEDESKIIEAFTEALTGKTKLAFFDHIISATSLILPVKEIVQALKEKGVESFVDGAQAIGQIDVNLSEIGAAYYAGNHHKWLCAPVASGFLHVRKGKQADVLPAIGSGTATREHDFQERFSWIGTFDPSAVLCTGETIGFMNDLHPRGWPGIFEDNHNLAVQARDMLCQKLGIQEPCPDEMIGSMFSLPLGQINFPQEILDNEAPHRRLAKLLKDECGYEVYGIASAQDEDTMLMRVSAHLYNDISQYERLAEDMCGLLQKYGVRQKPVDPVDILEF